MVKLFCKITQLNSIRCYGSVKKCCLFGKWYWNGGELKRYGRGIENRYGRGIEKWYGRGIENR